MTVLALFLHRQPAVVCNNPEEWAVHSLYNIILFVMALFIFYRLSDHTYLFTLSTRKVALQCKIIHRINSVLFLLWFSVQLLVWQLLGFLLAVAEGAQLHHSRIGTHLFEFVAFFLFFGLFLLGFVLSADADLLVSVLDLVQQTADYFLDLFCFVGVSALGKITEPIHFYFLLARYLVCWSVLRADHPQMID